MTSFPIPFHQLTCTCGHSAYLYTAVTCAALKLLTALSACVSTVSMRTTSSISCAPTYSTGSGIFLSSIPLSPLKELVSRCFSSYFRQFMQIKRTLHSAEPGVHSCVLERPPCGAKQSCATLESQCQWQGLKPA